MEKERCFKTIQEIKKGGKISLSICEFGFLIVYLRDHYSSFTVVSEIFEGNVLIYKKEIEGNEKVDIG